MKRNLLLLSFLFSAGLVAENNNLNKFLGVKIEDLTIPKLSEISGYNRGSLQKEPSEDLYSLSTRPERIVAVEILNRRLTASRQKTTRERELVLAQKERLARFTESDAIFKDPQNKLVQEVVRLAGELQRRLDERLEISRAIPLALEQHIKLITAHFDLLHNEKKFQAAKSLTIDDFVYLKNEQEALDGQLKVIQAKRERLSKQHSMLIEQINSKKAHLAKLSDERFGLGQKVSDVGDFEVSLQRSGEDFSKIILNLKITLTETEFKIARLRRKKNRIDYFRLADEHILCDLKKRLIENLLYKNKNKIIVEKADIQKISEELRAANQAFEDFRAKQAKLLEDLKKKRAIDGAALETAETRLRNFSAQTASSKESIFMWTSLLATVAHQREAMNKIEQSIADLELNEAELEIAVHKIAYKLNWIQFLAIGQHPETDLSGLTRIVNQRKLQVDAKIKELEAGQNFDYNHDAIIESSLTDVADLKVIEQEVHKRQVDLNLSGPQIENLLKAASSAIVALENSIHSSVVEAHKKKTLAILNGYRSIFQKYKHLSSEVSERRGEKLTWYRSPHAVSKSMMIDAFESAERLTIKFFWMTQEQLSPSLIAEKLKNTEPRDFLLLMMVILLFLIFAIISKYGLKIFKKRVDYLYGSYSQSLTKQSTLSQVIEIILDHFWALFSWCFFLGAISAQKVIGSAGPFSPYFQSLFFLFSIPFLIVVCHWLLCDAIGTKWADKLFRQKTKEKTKTLVSAFFYSGSVILPLVCAFKSLDPGPYSKPITKVLLGAYTLIAEIVILLFFEKEDFTALFPKNYRWTEWLHKKLDEYYYPTFFFLMTILIMYNPFVGYFNLAWKVTFLVPVSIIVLYILTTFHKYIRENLLLLFVQDEDETIIERFENAKLFYGFLVVASFLSLLLIGTFSLFRIWGVHYTPHEFWHALLDRWTIPVDQEHNFGFIQGFEIIGMLFFGVFFSSMVNRFVVSKFFDSFNSDPGLENTVNRITQYTIVTISLISSLYLTGLGRFVPQLLFTAMLAIGYALRDQMSDLAGGVFILLERQFEVGHFIQIDSENNILGTVHKISFRSTVIRTSRNFFVAVPNRIMISKSVTNWGMGKVAIGAEVTIRVGLNQDPKTVVAAISRAIDKNTQILKVPSPVIRLDEFTDSAIIFFVRVFFSGKKVREMWNISSDIRMAIINEFAKTGIEIPYPRKIIEFGETAKNSLDQEAIDDIKMSFDNDGQKAGFIQIKIPKSDKE